MQEIIKFWADGLTYNEIAKKLSISSKTVDTQILRAKIKLQNQLKKIKYIKYIKYIYIKYK